MQEESRRQVTDFADFMLRFYLEAENQFFFRLALRQIESSEMSQMRAISIPLLEKF